MSDPGLESALLSCSDRLLSQHYWGKATLPTEAGSAPSQSNLRIYTPSMSPPK